MCRLGIYIILISITQGLFSQDTIISSKKISLLFIGDIMCHDEQLRSASKTDTSSYNFDDVFIFIKPLIMEADIAIANLEVTLDGSPYRGYPRFSSPVQLAEACRNAGIDYLVTANNHSADRGKRGIINTIARLDSLGVHHTGTFTCQAERDTAYPLIIRKNGASFALLNYTFGTNGIEVPSPVIVNMINNDQITADIIRARELCPDKVILFLHWGTEYDSIPSEIQHKTAGYFIEAGADLVIGSHPHAIQKMVWQTRKDGNKDEVIIYSLGNFVSNQRKQGTDGGAMVKIDYEKEENQLVVSDAFYYLTWVYTPVTEDGKKFYILPCYRFENDSTFFNSGKDYRKMKVFINNSRRLLGNQNINVRELQSHIDK